MDTEPEPIGSSEIKPPPSQTTLHNILIAVNKLAKTGELVLHSRCKTYYLNPLKGWDLYSKLSVSIPTKEGRQKLSDQYPEAEISLFSRDEHGEKQIGYKIYRQGQDNLTITRYDTLTTEDEEDVRNKSAENIILSSDQERKEEIEQLVSEITRKKKSQKMEDETGVSYVDAPEAKKFLEDLERLIEYEHPN